jgi:cellulose synthase/poly-beta-1,6-N-acetylglucosamine synthase-like glycosyltransferase
MIIIWAIWILLQVLIGYNLYLPLILFTFYKPSKQTLPPLAPDDDYAIIVTAYEQVDSIPNVIASILKLNYTNYVIYIVADKCDVSSLSFNDDRVVILRPPETLASNTRSHFYAIHNFKRPHTRLTIIDSDNLVEPEYLHELDRYFNAGFSVVQGIREAKNLNTTYACLDAARDIYYHFYDGKILFGIGSSATLAGSGMAFTTQLYRDCLESRDIIGAGFDKVLQSIIVGQNLRIAFTDKAIVYDEKTTHSDQLVKQRSRWINTWFKYFKFGFTLVFKFLILSMTCMLANVFISITAVFIWLLGLIVFVLGFYIALAKSDTDKRIWQSLINIPKFIFYQVLSLLKVWKANKHSIATTHYYNTDSVENDKLKSDES